MQLQTQKKDDVKAHGFLFKAAMILAILERRKTQTRRAVTVHNSLIDGTGYGIRKHWPKLQWDLAWVDKGPSPAGNPGQYWKVPCNCMGETERVVHRVYPRVQPEDLIWAKETWQVNLTGDPKNGGPGTVPIYRATTPNACGRWRSAMLMPRWATRLELPVLQVRAERVQDISEDDARAEGCIYSADPRQPNHGNGYRRQFWTLWDSINGARHGMTWADSPPVWVYQWERPA